MVKSKQIFELKDEIIIKLKDTKLLAGEIKKSLARLKKEKAYPGDEEMLKFILKNFSFLARYISGLSKTEKNFKLIYPEDPVGFFTKNKSMITWSLTAINKLGGSKITGGKQK